ncbi:MAG TPA: c-type cytochrome [Gemmatimonadaceae bacterium]
MNATYGMLIGSASLVILAGVAVMRDHPQAPDGASPAVLALGDSVFHGKVGGALCYVCHGPAGKGVTGLGPNLTDKEWVNGDGTLAFIEKVVNEGVAKPKKMPAPMPPKGGGTLNDAQIKAAAAYVFSLSQPKN